MSHPIEVRLLFANLGHAAGDVVEMDNIEAIDWCARRLAEPVDQADLATAIAERADHAALGAEQAAAIAASPPGPRRRAPKMSRSNRAR